jgi:outer membrane protein OmpA-like peptidoglycan-associated protein
MSVGTNINSSNDSTKNVNHSSPTDQSESTSDSKKQFLNRSDLTDDKMYPLKFSTGTHKIVISNAESAHIVRLIGLTFDSNKCFLLPYALTGIKAIIKMHTQHTSAEVLIVGHDGSDEELKGVDLAYCRAEVLGAYLTNNKESWLRFFGKNVPPKIRWGTREVQLMLSSLPEGKVPFYIGNATGVTDKKTKDAVIAFQTHWNKKKGTALKIDGIAGPKTQKELVTAYMEIENTTVASTIKPVIHGCEGQFEDDLTLQGMQPDDRIIEIFFFEKGINPKPKDKTSLNGSTDYFKWKSQIIETKSFEFHGLHVQVIDKKKRPVKCAKVFLKGPKDCEGYTDEQGFVFFTGLIAGDYEVTAEKKGIEINSSKISYPTAKTKSRAIKKK